MSVRTFCSQTNDMKKYLLLGALVLIGAGCTATVNTVDDTADAVVETSSVVNSDNIHIFTPENNEVISGTFFTVTGEGRTFESVVDWRVTDDATSLTQEGFVMADSADIGLFGNFEINIPNLVIGTGSMTVEVFQYSAKDGSEIDKVTFTVLVN
jgi:hypothetical protein